MKLTINRLSPNGSVNAIADYGEGDWCILVFPSQQAAQEFAGEHRMFLEYTQDVEDQLAAIEAARSTQTPAS